MGQREERLTTFMSSSVASALVKNPELFWDGLERPERMGQHGERLTTFMCGGVASKEGEYRVVYCTATFSTAEYIILLDALHDLDIPLLTFNHYLYINCNSLGAKMNIKFISHATLQGRYKLS